jgi:DNA-binding transcriptional regulator YhcF (GntR family)
MIYDLGPRARRVYDALRERIDGGDLTTGSQLPSHLRVADEFGVAPLTVRQVFARLEEEGLVVREQGRGTFVRAQTPPAVLIVDDEAGVRAILTEHVARAGYLALTAPDPDTGMRLLETEPNIALVISDIRMPQPQDGIGFIRTARRRWPELPRAAVTAYPTDLADLHGAPECPVLVVPKPFRAPQIWEVLRLALQPAARQCSARRASAARQANHPLPQPEAPRPLAALLESRV